MAAPSTVDGCPDASIVHALYRYSDTTNGKPRPPYFSKRLALRSFLRELAHAGSQVSVTFLIDGEVPADIERAMREAGSIRYGRWRNSRASYAAQLKVAKGHRTRLVWFAEDDYLYAAGSLSALASAVVQLPHVNWFALSGPTQLDRLELRLAQSAVPLPHSEHWAPDTTWRDPEGRTWRRIDSTTSTFGGRPEAVRRVRWLMRLCPWSGAAWDRTTCLAIQGATPYPWRYLLTDLLPASTPPRWRALRIAWRVISRVAVNVAALTQRRSGEVLIAPSIPMVGHMDLPYEERAAKWDAIANQLLASDASSGET